MKHHCAALIDQKSYLHMPEDMLLITNPSKAQEGEFKFIKIKSPKNHE